MTTTFKTNRDINVLRSIWPDLLYSHQEERRMLALLTLRDILSSAFGWSTLNVHGLSDTGAFTGIEHNSTVQALQLKLIFLTIDFLLNYPTSLKYISQIESIEEFGETIQDDTTGEAKRKEIMRGKNDINEISLVRKYLVQFIKNGFPIDMILNIEKLLLGKEVEQVISTVSVEIVSGMLHENSNEIIKTEKKSGSTGSSEHDIFEVHNELHYCNEDSDSSEIDESGSETATHLDTKLLSNDGAKPTSAGRMTNSIDVEPESQAASANIATEGFMIQSFQKEKTNVCHLSKPSLSFQINCLTLLTTLSIEFDFYLYLPLEFFHLLELLQIKVMQSESLLSSQPSTLSTSQSYTKNINSTLEDENRLLQFFAAQCLSEFEANYPGLLLKWVVHNAPSFIQPNASPKAQSIGENVIYQSLYRLSQCCNCQLPSSLISSACSCGIFITILEFYSLYDPTIRSLIPINSNKGSWRLISQSLPFGVPKPPLLVTALANTTHSYHNGLVLLMAQVLRSLMDSVNNGILSNNKYIENREEAYFNDRDSVDRLSPLVEHVMNASQDCDPTIKSVISLLSISYLKLRHVFNLNPSYNIPDSHLGTIFHVHVALLRLVHIAAIYAKGVHKNFQELLHTSNNSHHHDRTFQHRIIRRLIILSEDATYPTYLRHASLRLLVSFIQLEESLIHTNLHPWDSFYNFSFLIPNFFGDSPDLIDQKLCIARYLFESQDQRSRFISVDTIRLLRRRSFQSLLQCAFLYQLGQRFFCTTSSRTTSPELYINKPLDLHCSVWNRSRDFTTAVLMYGLSNQCYSNKFRSRSATNTFTEDDTGGTKTRGLIAGTINTPTSISPLRIYDGGIDLRQLIFKQLFEEAITDPCRFITFNFPEFISDLVYLSLEFFQIILDWIRVIEHQFSVKLMSVPKDSRDLEGLNNDSFLLPHHAAIFTISQRIKYFGDYPTEIIPFISVLNLLAEYPQLTVPIVIPSLLTIAQNIQLSTTECTTIWLVMQCIFGIIRKYIVILVKRSSAVLTGIGTLPIDHPTEVWRFLKCQIQQMAYMETFLRELGQPPSLIDVRTIADRMRLVEVPLLLLRLTFEHFKTPPDEKKSDKLEDMIDEVSLNRCSIHLNNTTMLTNLTAETIQARHISSICFKIQAYFKQTEFNIASLLGCYDHQTLPEAVFKMSYPIPFLTFKVVSELRSKFHGLTDQCSAVFPDRHQIDLNTNEAAGLAKDLATYYILLDEMQDPIDLQIPVQLELIPSICSSIKAPLEVFGLSLHFRPNDEAFHGIKGVHLAYLASKTAGNERFDHSENSDHIQYQSCTYYPFVFETTLRIPVRQLIPTQIQSFLCCQDSTGQFYMGGIGSIHIKFADFFLPVILSVKLRKKLFFDLWNKQNQTATHTAGCDDQPHKCLALSVRVLDLPRHRAVQQLRNKLGPFLIDSPTILPEDNDLVCRSSEEDAISSTSQTEMFRTRQCNFDFDPSVYETTEICSSTDGEMSSFDNQSIHDEVKQKRLLPEYDHYSSGYWSDEDRFLIEALVTTSKLNKEKQYSHRQVDKDKREEPLVIVFIPPKAHLLFKFHIEEISTLVEIATTEERFLEHIDEFFDDWIRDTI